MKPKVRWHEAGRIFLAEFGNIRFAVSKTACIELIAALEQAVRLQKAKERHLKEEGRG